MSARSRIFDYALLAAGVLVAWVLLFRWAGPEALSPPVPTFRRIGEFLISARFWDHVEATGLAFAYACLIALAGGLAVGFALGANRFAGQVGEPILTTLYAIPKITLYPVILLDLRARRFGQDRLRRHPRIFPGRPVHHRRHQEHQSRADQDGAGDAAVAGRRPSAPCCFRPPCRRSSPGCASAFSTTLLGTLIGELFASDRGVGFILIRAMEAHQVTDIMALTLLLFAFAAGANAVLLAIEHRMHRR